MKYLLFALLVIPSLAKAHPGVGIVKDSKGSIFYTDLSQVWKITNGIKTVAVPNVHTHELYIDEYDNLYGENGRYVEQENKFYHYLWKLPPNGKIDTVIPIRQDYLQFDFSLARDSHGNQYYLKKFFNSGDTNHIYKNTPDGKETILATVNIKPTVWLHPQQDGSLLYVANNALYKVDSLGKIQLIKDKIGNAKPSFRFSENNITIWGAWQDDAGNYYVAAFSDQAVKKIDKDGTMSTVFTSKGDDWTVLSGVFDNNNKLWVLEGSDKNEVRVTMAEVSPGEATRTNNSKWIIYLPVGGFIAFLLFRMLKPAQSKSR